MRPALDPAGHRVPQTKPTCLLHTWRPHRRRPFALVLHLHQHQSSRNLHLQYLAKNQSTQHCQSLITQGSDHPPVLEPHMVLKRRKVVERDPTCCGNFPLQAPQWRRCRSLVGDELRETNPYSFVWFASLSCFLEYLIFLCFDLLGCATCV
jgi:hypothetical protein